MNREIKKVAAADYALTQDLNRNEELVCVKAFCAGAEWAELKWIPVTERLPEIGQPVIIRCVKVELHFDLVYFDGSFHTKHITHWCPIPDSLLNFKP